MDCIVHGVAKSRTRLSLSLFVVYLVAHFCAFHRLSCCSKCLAAAPHPQLSAEMLSTRSLQGAHTLDTGSKLGNECLKAVYRHAAYLTYMQSTSCEMLDWMEHKLESKLPGEISITSQTCR